MVSLHIPFTRFELPRQHFRRLPYEDGLIASAGYKIVFGEIWIPYDTLNSFKEAFYYSQTATCAHSHSRPVSSPLPAATGLHSAWPH